MPIADTVYAQMLQMQMAGAERAWLEAERQKETRESREQGEFDRFANVMNLILKAQQQRHQEEMDRAKLIGAGEGKLGMRMAPSMGSPQAEKMRRSAEFSTMGDVEEQIRLNKEKESLQVARMEANNADWMRRLTEKDRLDRERDKEEREFKAQQAEEERALRKYIANQTAAERRAARKEAAKRGISEEEWQRKKYELDVERLELQKNKNSGGSGYPVLTPTRADRLIRAPGE